jgi:hypothetical protein
MAICIVLKIKFTSNIAMNKLLENLFVVYKPRKEWKLYVLMK